jgi:hypothetical protein
VNMCWPGSAWGPPLRARKRSARGKDQPRELADAPERWAERKCPKGHLARSLKKSPAPFRNSQPLPSPVGGGVLLERHAVPLSLEGGGEGAGGRKALDMEG